MEFPITTLAAALMGLLFIVLSMRVIRQRQTNDSSEQSKSRLERRIRGHANFAEYTPMILILLGLAEVGGANQIVVWVGAATLVVGRLLHGYAFAFSDFSPVGRSGGTLFTLVSLVILMLANGWLVIAG